MTGPSGRCHTRTHAPAHVTHPGEAFPADKGNSERSHSGLPYASQRTCCGDRVLRLSCASAT